MRAIVVDRWTEPRDLGVREVPEPELGPGTPAVEVRAAGCNFFDILMVRGQYQVKPAFPFIPGAELAGVVRAVGPGGEGLPAAHRIRAPRPSSTIRSGATGSTPRSSASPGTDGSW